MSVDTSGISSVGSAAVNTIGTVAIVGATAKVVGKAVGGAQRKSKNYNVWHGTKSKGSKKSKSMLGF